MPRQLPWKVNTGPRLPAPRKRTTESPSSVHSASPAPSEGRSAGKPKSGTSTPIGAKSRRSLTAKPDRSPSTSPPPQPISEDFMIEGFDHDDKYRVVEDEFLAMAGNFTKHLHAAEYQRLKALASTRNADMIRTISRPLTGRMSELVKRRRSDLKLAASQRKGLKTALGKRKAGRDDSDSDDDGDELPWAGTSLQGLMESPRKKAVPLPAGSSFSHGERASTTVENGSKDRFGVSGFAGRVAARPANPHVETTTDEDEDDLDTQLKYVATTDRSKGSESNSTLSLNRKAVSTEAVARVRDPALPIHGREPPRSTSTMSIEKPPTVSPLDTTNDLEDDDDDFMARIRNRRAQQQKRHEGTGTGNGTNKRKHNSAVDAIPLF